MMGIDDSGHFQRAEGPVHTSLGQRPGTEAIMELRAESPIHN
jgi:hypothetical protein